MTAVAPPLGARGCGATAPSPLQLAKQAVRIPRLWEFYGLPGDPGTSCRSPFRLDHKPSFSVYDDGRRWNDFGTDEGGDAADFVARAEGLDKSAAAKRLIELHRGGMGSGAGSGAAGTIAAGADEEEREWQRRRGREAKRATWPTLREPRDDERRQIADLRHLDIGAIDLACKRGVLLAAQNCRGDTAWIVSDQRRINAQARRLDGRPWPYRGDKIKAKSLPGSVASWPVGIAGAEALASILLVEGGPDALAACQMIFEADAQGHVGVAAMLGRGLRIHPDAVPAFANKRVLIVPHADEDGGGLEAAGKWARQLKDVAADVGWVDLRELRPDGARRIKDLNEFVAASPACREANAYFVAEIRGWMTGRL